MAAFGSPPLLCESYAADSKGNFRQVACPFPTSQHIFTQVTWERNTASLRCNGNNSTLCALSSTPLTQSTYTTTTQLLEFVQTAASLLADTDVVETCDFASDSALDIWTETCNQRQLRTPLMGAWVTCTIAAACGFILAPLLLVIIRASAPYGISQVDVVYNPGACLLLPTPTSLLR